MKGVDAAMFAMVVGLACAGASQALPAVRPDDVRTLDACVAKAGDLDAACIGVVADACLKTADSTQRMGDCESRELAVWDGWLNRDYAKVMASLKPALRTRLRAIERGFAADRDARCGFVQDVNGPTTMNTPAIQECAVHATAEQWLWLKAYLPAPTR